MGVDRPDRTCDRFQEGKHPWVGRSRPQEPPDFLDECFVVNPRYVYRYLHLVDFYIKRRFIFTSPMDPMGMCAKKSS